jgi:hypothetical protein
MLPVVMMWQLLLPAVFAHAAGPAVSPRQSRLVETARPTIARMAHTATPLADGRILVAGGFTDPAQAAQQRLRAGYLAAKVGDLFRVKDRDRKVITLRSIRLDRAVAQPQTHPTSPRCEVRPAIRGLEGGERQAFGLSRPPTVVLLPLSRGADRGGSPASPDAPG